MIFIAFHQFDRHNTTKKVAIEIQRKERKRERERLRKKRKHSPQTVLKRPQYIFSQHECYAINEVINIEGEVS